MTGRWDQAIKTDIFGARTVQISKWKNSLACFVIQENISRDEQKECMFCEPNIPSSQEKRKQIQLRKVNERKKSVQRSKM